jgi:hypothetical protein
LSSSLAYLNNTDQELLFKAPLLVCILIAGADGRIDDREVDKALEMARRNYWVKSALRNFYAELSKDFEDKLKVTIQSYPADPVKRTAAISAELAQVNGLWHKLDPTFSCEYFEMLRYLANRIASSSGRFWARITEEEARLLELPMLTNPSKK